MTILDKIKEAKRAIQEKEPQIPYSKTDEDLKNPEEEVFTADKYPALKKTINRAPKSAVEAALASKLQSQK